MRQLTLIVTLFLLVGTHAVSWSFGLKRHYSTQVERLGRLAPKLDKNIIKLALIAYQRARRKGQVKKPILTIIDYHKPSTQRRIWVFDLKRTKLFYNGLVAHGAKTGANLAHYFSNRYGSHQSSLGVYVTGRTYYGHKGLSMNLRGMEPGFNDHALKRRIVMHGAWYVSQSFAKHNGRLGLSWGCPALSMDSARKVINKIKSGSLVFAYYPSWSWLHRSSYLV